ncbi:PDR/VanB family oxidoreductase [Actinomycetospora termitidis]|uniref:PDR/VanB family oxidoreductase n=1 Tax=Actinomycetospora termitidis TaxID=3053470 RepID=A0ABT7MGK4_9PSEU|nr:PDR/VanB family oxidoreductase [Actinomycetospora sp. Odt1-22]MDL5159810.1 PDR/VanB family oxidoreductase [Actinomycetospora sp. Odt1-22]
MELIVRDRRDEADGVVSLTLADPDGHDLPVWTAGAHVDVTVDDGVVRQYSLSSDPADRTVWRLGVLREPAGRGGSEFVCTKLDVGDLVEVSTPRNHFELVPAGRYLFVAGGIGITPVLAMIARARATGAEWSLVYGGRTRSSMAFLDELGVYGDRVTVVPQDEQGLLPLADVLGGVAPGTLVYACGPEPMLAAVEAHVVDRAALHLERFTPKIVEGEGPDEAFEVEFATSGLTATVPAESSILAVAEELGLPVDFSCREGTCGSCETPILAGRAEHRDSVLESEEQAENTCLMICVSRAERGCARLRLEL